MGKNYRLCYEVVLIKNAPPCVRFGEQEQVLLCRANFREVSFLSKCFICQLRDWQNAWSALLMLNVVVELVMVVGRPHGDQGSHVLLQALHVVLMDPPLLHVR